MSKTRPVRRLARALTRRDLLRQAGLVAGGSLLAAACQPAAQPPPATQAPASSPAAASPAAASPAAASPAAASPPAASPAAVVSPATAASPAAAAPNIGGTPRRGGELSFVVSAEPPSFDGHRETTFAMLHPTAPHYSLLIKVDPDKYPDVTGDVAESWTISPDGLTYTFKLRDNVLFHDGQKLTSRDVKASYDRILNPPQGVVSARRGQYAAFESVEAPDPLTVVFKLKYPSPAALGLLAAPWNYLYSADKLAEDPRWPEKNINGTGPFEFVEFVPGSHWVGKRFDRYFQPGKPYLDGFRATFIRDTAAQVSAVRSNRAAVEFRGFTPTARDDLVRALGSNVVVQESSWITALIVTINTTKEPFNDVRVRRALNLAIDRWEASESLSKITFVKPVGLLVRPGGPYSRPEAEIQRVPGFGRDINAAREQARALLREAGIAEGTAMVLKNRDVPQPYEPVGVFLLDQWRRIGLNVTQQPQETSAYLADLRNGNFDFALDFTAEYSDEPDVLLSKYLSTKRTSQNYANYEDTTVDDLFDRQSRERDPEARKRLIWQLEDRIVGEQAYILPTIWWQRIIPHSSRLKGWRITPSHYINQDLADVWLE